MGTIAAIRAAQLARHRQTEYFVVNIDIGCGITL
jgi:hypothetical protein